MGLRGLQRCLRASIIIICSRLIVKLPLAPVDLSAEFKDVASKYKGDLDKVTATIKRLVAHDGRLRDDLLSLPKEKLIELHSTRFRAPMTRLESAFLRLVFFTKFLHKPSAFFLSPARPKFAALLDFYLLYF